MALQDKDDEKEHLPAVDDLVNSTAKLSLNCQYADNVLRCLKETNSKDLKVLYLLLAEVEDIDTGKNTCFQLYSTCFKEMLNIIKDINHDKTIRYHVWHYLQLMTCCSQVKDLLFLDDDALRLLLKFNKLEWTNEELSSMRYITVNYILIMLAGAPDDYYEFIGSSDVIPYFHKTLTSSKMSPDDELFELVLLGLNLLLEGSGICKRKLIEFDFKSLLSTKIEEREICRDNLMNIAKKTYEKLLLLESDQKSFVETFRQGCKEELKKSVLYRSRTCANTCCQVAEGEDDSDVNEVSFKYCAQCKQVAYCSKDCQIAHWKASHSKVCKKP